MEEGSLDWPKYKASTGYSYLLIDGSEPWQTKNAPLQPAQCEHWNTKVLYCGDGVCSAGEVCALDC